MVCQLELSGKWPDEEEAVEGIKTAFYIHLARAFQEQQGGVASPTPHYLDVFKVKKSTIGTRVQCFNPSSLPHSLYLSFFPFMHPFIQSLSSSFPSFPPSPSLPLSLPPSLPPCLPPSLPPSLSPSQDGYVFRLRIHYHRELTLLREKVSMATGSETNWLQEKISQMEHTLVSLPLHTSTLHGYVLILVSSSD